MTLYCGMGTTLPQSCSEYLAVGLEASQSSSRLLSGAICPSVSFNQLRVLQCDSWGVPETQPLVSKGCQNKVALFGHPTRALSNVILHCRLWLCVLSLSLACGLEGIELAFICQMLLGQLGKVLPLQAYVCKSTCLIGHK